MFFLQLNKISLESHNCLYLVTHLKDVDTYTIFSNNPNNYHNKKLLPIIINATPISQLKTNLAVDKSTIIVCVYETTLEDNHLKTPVFTEQFKSFNLINKIKKIHKNSDFQQKPKFSLKISRKIGKNIITIVMEFANLTYIHNNISNIFPSHLNYFICPNNSHSWIKINAEKEIYYFLCCTKAYNNNISNNDSKHRSKFSRYTNHIICSFIIGGSVLIKEEFLEIFNIISKKTNQEFKSFVVGNTVVRYYR